MACLYTLPRASERRLATRPGHLTAEASEDVRAAHRLVELAVQLLVVPRCCPRLGKARGLLLRQARHQFGQHIHAAERAAASENRGACKRVVKRSSGDVPRQEIASQPAARCGAARPCERPGLRAAQRSYRPRAPADMKRRCGGTASAQLVGQIGIGRRMAGRDIDSRTGMARFKLTHGDLAHRQSSGIAVRTIAQCKTQSSAQCFFWVGDSSVLCVWHSCTVWPKR